MTKPKLQPDKGRDDSDQVFSPELAELIRNRPLPRPSDRKTQTVLAAARAKNASEEPDPALDVVQRRSAGEPRFRLRPAFAIAACLALAGLVWLSTTGLGPKPAPGPTDTGPAIGSTPDTDTAADVLAQLDQRLDHARESLVRLRRRGAGLRAHTVHAQPISRRLVRLRGSAAQLRNQVSIDMQTQPGST